MWQSNPKPTISPNLLSNFNPLDILQPQKSSANSDGPQVAKLIDLDETHNESIDASFLDQKTEYDLVDLLQNIYVSPQQVKLKDNDSAGSSKEVANNIDFKDFFDKIESGQKVDWSAEDCKEEKRLQHEYIHEKPKVLGDDELTDIHKKTKVRNDESDPEDLIDEILAAKSMEKIILAKIYSERNLGSPTIDKISSNVKKDLPRVKVLSVPTNMGFETPTNITSNNASNHASKAVKDTANARIDIPSIKILSAPNNVVFEASKRVTSNIVNNQTNKEVGFNPNNTKVNSAAECSRTNLYINVPINVKASNTTPNNVKIDERIINTPNFKLYAFKKDEKIYKKKRIEKPESETRYYTKGADFNEKSIVLPQIMQRIMAEKARLEEKSTYKNKFILDSGSAGTRSEKIVIEKVKENIKMDSFVNPVSSKEVKNSDNVDKYSVYPGASDIGQVYPTILMEDCNRERLKAWKMTETFRNFVLNGK